MNGACNSTGVHTPDPCPECKMFAYVKPMPPTMESWYWWCGKCRKGFKTTR